MSELGPSPQSEEEKETQGISFAKEIADLRSRAETDEDFSAVLSKIQTLKELYGLVPSSEAKLSSEVTEQMAEAKEILGQDFLGPEEIKAVFGLETIEVPPIPFSREELERAKELGQFLILRTDQIPPDKLELPHTRKTLESAPETRWALVTKELIPDSTNKDYIDQTDQMITYLEEQVFSGRGLPPEYESAATNFRGQKEKLKKLAESSDITKTLADLAITKLIRQNRDELLYDLEVYKAVTDQYLLRGDYAWTSSRDSAGNMVDVGRFDSDGIHVCRYRPDTPNPNLGAVLSRSQ